MAERLSPGQIAHLVSLVRDGTPDPGETQQLLEEFVRCVTASEPVPPAIMEYLGDAFRSYLADSPAAGSSRVLVQALGLMHKTAGNPGASAERALVIAIEVLRGRMAGQSHESALLAAGEKWGCGKTKASSAWSAHRADALLALRVERAAWGPDWTQRELTQLRSIFRHTPDLIPPKLR